ACLATLLRATHDGPLIARPLHSSPTRRSSDLVANAIDRELAYESRRTVTVPGAAPRSAGGNGSSEGDDLYSHSVAMRPGGGPRKDRKSTRLNSSHQIISYAVFCLKTKRQRQHI